MGKPDLYPCEVNGSHKVENIKALNKNNEYDKHVMRTGYLWGGVCKFCNKFIIGKTKEELAR